MLVTSANSIQGAEAKRLGQVNGEYIIEEKIYKAILTEMAKYEEIRTEAYQAELEKARQTVMDQMTKKAEALGANAILGINIWHEIIGYGKLMMIAGKGVAAFIEGEDL